MKLIIYTIIITCMTIGYVSGQQNFKNSLETKPFVMYNYGFADGEFIAYGLGLEYSRVIYKRFGGSFFVGKGGMNGRNANAFALEPDEKSALGYNHFNLDLDFLIVGNEKIRISAGGGYAISQFKRVAIQIKSGDKVVYRQVSQKNLPIIFFNLKMENRLAEKTFWTTQFSYQPYAIDAMEVIMLRTGIGYRF